MIERLKESEGRAFGLKVSGRVTAEEVDAFLPQLEMAIRERGKRTIGVLADRDRVPSPPHAPSPRVPLHAR